MSRNGEIDELLSESVESNVPSKRSLVFVKGFYKKEIDMKHVISYLKKELGNCEALETISFREDDHHGRKFYAQQCDEFRTAISILEKAENKK